ncbi:hypothetical protein [Frondihabitans australicus]|uniref:Uncharacterized protein n=1 Tax=Frondihabitans australicus TaxID=386892 RepID=A0A495IAW3_9MICO|nr:hypothetical protein [Frondihabitans australicus]RKR73143.1 hypothetical protein C8E83_0231 [Frondihabitans australicus]
MSIRESTAQQTDPLGALNQRPITVVIALFAVVLAAGRTVVDHDAGADVPLAVLAVALVMVAAGVMVRASSPFRAPFTRRSFGVIAAAGTLALVVEGVSTYRHDLYVHDDWGGAVLGLLLLSCAPFRPGRDLAVATGVGAVVQAVVVVAEIPYFATPAPPVLFLVVGITPVIALGVGAAVYAATFVHLVRLWLERASALTVDAAREMRPGIARSVQQDRVTGLNKEVVPFFTDLVAGGEVTEADRRRATEVATAIRQRIVDESDRSWLEQVLLDVCPRGEAGTVIDRGRLAEAMTSDQRTAIRAVVGAMAVDPDTRSSSLGIVLHDDAPMVRALIRVESSSPDVAIRQHYAPYFAVLRILFTDLHVDVSGSFLTLRFSYEQH